MRAVCVVLFMRVFYARVFMLCALSQYTGANMRIHVRSNDFGASPETAMGYCLGRRRPYARIHLRTRSPRIQEPDIREAK